MDLLSNLNPEQLAAVQHKDGPLLIVAGAGTGKTTVIAQRIAYLIEQGLAQPEEILGLTFTEKGAGEMADRVGSLLPYGYFDLWISTFHSFSERILKEHGLAIGLSTDFKLLNEFEQWALIKKNLAKFELDYYRPLGAPAKFIHALLKHFSRAKDEDISPAAYLEYAGELKQNLDGMLSGGKAPLVRGPACHCEARAGRGRGVSKGEEFNPLNSPLSLHAKASDDKQGGQEIAEQEASRINEVANAYHRYQQLLLDNNALDFGDLINYTLKLFRERPAILEIYRRQFKYIMLDEFQDTNWSQYELIKILAEPKNNLTVVGDDDQSIFRFRGASMSNILQFNQDYPAAKKIILVKNYRSRQNILDLSYEFIKQNNPNRLEWQLAKTSPSPLLRKEGNQIVLPLAKGEIKEGVISNSARFNKERQGGLNKKLVAENAGQGEIKVIAAVDLAGEIEQVADKIQELKAKDKAASWNDFAILVRANDSAGVFMDELDRRGLPYIFGARRGLYAKPVIMDAIAYFKLLDNYHESVCLWRILNLPVYDFTAAELADFNQAARRKAWSLYEVISRAETLKFSPETLKKIQPLLALVARQTALAREKDASEVFLAFMNDSGYLKYLAKKTERENLETMGLLNQFLKRLRDFTAASGDKSVKAFLTELNLELEAGQAGELAADLEAGPEAIKILTVHGAKGLEFKYVFIANLVDKRFPTIERSEPISLPAALIKEILPVGAGHLEEERRLFYVAMTRAGSGLYFSWAPDYGGLREKKPSRFLMELGLAEQGKQEAGSRQQELEIRKQAVGGEPLIPNSLFLIPPHFSYSQLAAYTNCPYQYRFAHILKIPVMGKEQFSFGKTMHATLQKLFSLINEKKGLSQTGLFGGITSPSPLLRKEGNQIVLPLAKGEIKEGVVTFDEILKLYEESWLDDWYESNEKKQIRKKQGREILKVFYEKHRAGWPEVLFLEKGFNLKITDTSAELPSSTLPSSTLPSTTLGTSGTSGTSEAGALKSYIIRGVIDRIDAAGPSTGSASLPTGQAGSLPAGSGQAGGLKLVDYKTGRAKEKLTFAEKEQLFIYQLAAEELFKLPVKSLAYYYLENNTEIEFIGQESDFKKIKAKIIFTIEKIKQGQFPPKPGRLCAFCDFNGICEYRA